MYSLVCIQIHACLVGDLPAKCSIDPDWPQELRCVIDGKLLGAGSSKATLNPSSQGVSRSHAASCMFLLSSPPSYEICFFQSNKICQTTCQTGKSFSWWYLPCFWGSSAVTLWTCLRGRYAWALSQNQSCMHMFVTLYNCIHLYTVYLMDLVHICSHLFTRCWICGIWSGWSNGSRRVEACVPLRESP